MGIQLDVLGSRALCEGEPEATKNECSLVLLGVQLFGITEVGQVLIIFPHHKRLKEPLRLVSPLLQHQNHCKLLSVTHVVVYLC